MKTHDFYYELPPELIAQTPLQKRDSSRLLVLGRESGQIEHRHFYDVIDYLKPGDTLVLNDSRVLPARLMGHRVPSGGAVEVLLLKDTGGDVWECLTRPGRKTPVGTQLCFGDGQLTAEVVEALDDGKKKVRFRYEGIFLEVLSQLGKMPLPPYIKEELEDQGRYQTVYSRVNGSAAAPTAGLHFTPELRDKIREKGIAVAPVLLHVGLGTFRPVREERIAEHEMHSEYLRVTQETAGLVNRRRAAGGRVIAVGTTSCRVLESAADEDGRLRAVDTDTGIFIYPGYRFRIVDALITNFHLPESTLLMLVSALADRETILRAYRTAVEMGYRFFSFGDAMFIK